MSIGTLTQLHEYWKAQLQDRLPVLNTVAAYKADDSDGRVATPAVLIDLEDFEEGPVPLDDPLPWTLRWSFFCLLSNQTPNPEMAAREMALAVAAVVKTTRGGFENAGEPERISALPATLRPGLKGYQCWVVGFEQEFSLDAEWPVAGLGNFVLAHVVVDLTADTPGLTGTDDIRPEQD